MVRPAKKILAVKLRKISELIVWTGALQTLRHVYPEAQIDILVPEEMSHVFKESPLIQKIHLVPRSGKFALMKILWRLRKEHYDLALGFDANRSLSRWLRLTRAKETCVHDHNRKKKPLFSHLAVDNPGELADNLHLDSKVLTSLGVLDRICQPKMFVSERIKNQALERLNFSFDQSQSKSKVVFLPGASLETKRYPRDLWLQAIDRMRTQKKVVIAVIADKALSEDWNLRSECYHRGLRLYDNLSFQDFLAYLSWFDVAICNDSAPFHLATAMGVHTISLFGPGNVGREHSYDRDRHIVLRTAVDCRPDGPRENERFQSCPLLQCSHLSCLRQIDPNQIAEKVTDLIEGVPIRQTRRA